MSSFNDFLLRYFLPLVGGFVVCALAADLVWSKAVLERTKHSDVARIRRAIENDDNRMAIHGASKARAAYIPSLLRVPAYNYGMDESSQAVANALIELELDKENSTAPILLDFPLFWFTGIGNEMKFVPFGRIPVVRELMTDAGKWKIRYLVPGLRFFGSFDWNLKELLTENIELTRRIEDGFTYRLTPVPWSRESFDSAVQRRLNTSVYYHEIESQRLRLENLIDEHSNRHFFIVISPYHPSFFRSYEGLPEAHRFLSDMEKRSNVTVLDYSRVDYADELFTDSTHLNEEGAKRFSNTLGEVLRAHPAFAEEPLDPQM